MKCLICKQGETHPGLTVVALQRDDRTLVIKGVPAEICENCGEYYLSDEIAKRVYRQAEESLEHGAEVEIGRFALSEAAP
jgi:YgiT-type zinc finger domain-containing protein